MKKAVLMMLVLGLAAFFAAGPARAEETPKPDEAAIAMEQKAAQPALMPDEARKVLDPLVGKWDYTITFRSASGAPEQTSKGTTENRWVLDGRYLMQNVTGTMDTGAENVKFNGIGYIGHESVTGGFRTIWLDNRNTESMISTGAYDPVSKTIRESGYYSCPLRGDEVKFDSELTFVDADHFTFTMYDTTAGERFKSMEIEYTRKR